MNSKKIIFIVMIIMLIISGGVVLHKSKITTDEVEEQTVQKQEECEAQEVSSILEVVSYEKEYFEEYKSTNFVVIVKNTSGEYLKKVEFTLGDANYELYEMENGEEYKVIAYSSEEEIELEVLSVDFEIKNYYFDEISVEYSYGDGKLSGTITNNDQRQLYPSQIVYFVTDDNGYTVQRTIEYAGCFDEGLVIEPDTTFEFETEYEDSYTFNSEKSVIVRYSDLYFRDIATVFVD